MVDPCLAQNTIPTKRVEEIRISSQPAFFFHKTDHETIPEGFENKLETESRPKSEPVPDIII
jgi:hypothetical protein